MCLVSPGRGHSTSWWRWRFGDSLPPLWRSLSSLSLALLLLHLLNHLGTGASEEVRTVCPYLGSFLAIKVKAKRSYG